tara:strand:- start:1503 stop:2567 length:1065 start_codon:yes stop_codon:yes gene_type:complete
MALTDPLGSNILIGGLQGNATHNAHNDTIGDQFVPELWGAAILDSFQKNTVMTQLGTDMSGMTGADVINLPHVGVPIVKAVSQNSETIEMDVTGTDTATTTQLKFDEHYVAPLWIPDAVKVQSTYNLFQLYSSQLGYAIAKTVDNFLMSTVANSLSSAIGSGDGVNANATMNVEVADSLTPANLASLMALIVGETGSTDGWTLVLGKTAYGALANSSNFGNSYTQGTQGAPLGGNFAQTGVVGNLLGMPVIASNSVFLDDGAVAADAEKGITKAWTGFDTGSAGADTADDDLLRGFAIHNSALYWGIQKSTVQSSYQHTYMSDLVSMDVIYGAVARCADSAGDRRIIALTDSLD